MEGSTEANRAKDLWKDFGGELLVRLAIEAVPIYRLPERQYIGINIVQVRYRNKHGEIKTRWIDDEPLKKKHQLLAWCQWTFLPLYIEPRKRSILPKDQRYWYLMKVEQGEVQEGGRRIQRGYAARIATAHNGILLQTIAALEDQGGNLSLKYKFAFPRQWVSRINRCLVNNFLPQYWSGPSYAAWHRTDEGKAFYLGCPSEPDDPELGQQLRRILNGPNGDAASILLAYSCFSMLKSFFPSYHTLHKDDSYFDVKKHLPEQLAICIQSDGLADAERLADICCGYFRRFEAPKEPKAMPIINGISIQKSPSGLKKLGVNEFEAKVIQPACVLWVNREPAMELIENGSILGIHISSPVEDDVGSVLSEALVYILADKIHKLTDEAYGKRFDADWEESAPQIERFFKRLKGRASSRFGEFSQEYMDVSDELTKYRHDRANFNEPLVLLKQIRYSIISKFDRCLWESPGQNPDIDLNLRNYCNDIQAAYTTCMRELKKIHNKNMRLLYSLDPAYRETVKRLLENPSVSLMGKETVKKVAYLSTSFQTFYQKAMPIEYHQELRDRVETSLIDAYQRQLGTYQPQNILEGYIFGLLEKGQCARIRGENSDHDHIRVWYNDRDRTFLIPSKDYFDRLKNPGSISKRDFENALVNAGILCTVRRKNQARRTFETVVRKGGSKLSVLKINAAALSAQFSKSAQKYLEQMKADGTPYRRRRS